MLKNKKKIILLIFIMAICIHTIVYGKYVIENTYMAATINIDRNPPEITSVYIQNTNSEYKYYANKSHKITVQLKVIEEHIMQNNFNTKNVTAFVGKNKIPSENIQIDKIEEIKDYITYNVVLTNIEGNGNLTLEVERGTIVDTSNNINFKKVIITNIVIDNIKPEYSFNEVEQADGKVMAGITANEKIRNIEGWDLSESQLVLQKEFTNNISYIFKITDFAQNVSEVKIDITKASNIKLTYATLNSNINNFLYAYGNKDIAGKEAVEKDSKLKVEVFTFNVEGAIESDFIQFKAFTYTHWGENTSAVCDYSELIYNYGYTPNDSTFCTMNSNNALMLKGKKFIQFGGSTINRAGKRSIGNNDPIPEDIAAEYRYGISEMQIKLKNYEKYSIVYQVLVDGVGWVQTASDGERCLYNVFKPFSAIRILLVPKSEKQYVVDLWNKDIGTFNLK